jgi:hypothetical protein
MMLFEEAVMDAAGKIARRLFPREKVFLFYKVCHGVIGFFKATCIIISTSSL